MIHARNLGWDSGKQQLRRQGLVQPPTITSLILLIIISGHRQLAAGEKLCGFIQSLWSKNPTVGKYLKNSWGNLCLGFVSPCAEITNEIQRKSGCYKSSHSPLVMSIIWLPSVRVFPWVGTFGRSKVWKMKHLHIMTDSWNNINIYTHWHGSTKLPIQLFMCCVQARHSPWLLSVEQLCGSQRQSTHTRPRFAPFCISADSMPQLLQNDAKAAKADFTPALSQGPQRYTALTASFTGWVSCTHSSAFPLLLHEPRGFPPPRQP